MEVFASYNPDSRIRAASSSGGIFSVIARKFIENGGAVYGAAFDSGWRVAHRRITTLEELPALRGSKYVYSGLDSSLAQIREDLKAGRSVLFSGTPCQVAAVRKLAGDHPALLLVEVVCHGAPEPKYWKQYIEEQCHRLKRNLDDIETINFRDKSTGWSSYSFSVTFKDGKTFKQHHDDCLYMKAFLSDYTLREACFKCPFKYPDGSRADITLGDFWGVEKVLSDFNDNQGVSEIICRTEKGLKFIENINIPGKSVDFDDIVAYNPALVSSAVTPTDLPDFKEYARHHSFVCAARKFADDPITLKIKKLISKVFHRFIFHT